MTEQMCVALVLGARPAIKAAAALPALFSSMKLIVELMISNTTMPVKSCQSGGLPCHIKLIVELTDLLETRNHRHNKKHVYKNSI